MIVRITNDDDDGDGDGDDDGDDDADYDVDDDSQSHERCQSLKGTDPGLSAPQLNGNSFPIKCNPLQVGCIRRMQSV